MSPEEKLRRESEIARGNTQGFARSQSQNKRTSGRRQDNNATIIGYNSATGQNVIRLANGSIASAFSDTNGAIALGESAPLNSVSMMVDGLPNRKNQLVSKKTAIIPKTSPIAVLFRITEGDFNTFYIGGHQKKPEKLISIPSASTIFHAVIDRSKNDYVVSIIHSTLTLFFDGVQEYYLESLRLIKIIGAKIVYTYNSTVIYKDNLFVRILFNSSHGVSQLFYLDNTDSFSNAYGGYVVTGKNDTTIYSSSFPNTIHTQKVANIDFPLFGFPSGESAHFIAGLEQGYQGRAILSHLPEITIDSTFTYAISLNRGKYYYSQPDNNTVSEENIKFERLPSLIYNNVGETIELNESPFNFDINSLGISADFFSRRTTLIKSGTNSLTAYCTGQWQTGGIIDERFDFRNKDINNPVTQTIINLIAPVASTLPGNNLTAKIFSLKIGDRPHQIYSISYFPPK